MLKWLVTGREGGGCEDQAGVTDDPLATLAGEISENIYNVNRSNPLFKDEDESESVNHKDKEPYKPSSYSSGYWSYRGFQQTESGLLHMTKLLENNSELESCNSVPHPVWPGVSGDHRDKNRLKGSYYKNIQDKLDTGNEWKGLGRNNYENFSLDKSYVIEGKRRDTKSQRKMAEDRCFGIRHQPVNRNYEGQNDSIVTNSVLLMTGHSSVDEDEYSGNEEAAGGDVTKQSREDMDKVIEELAFAVRQSKGVRVLTNAVEKTKQTKHHNQHNNNKNQVSDNIKQQRRRSIEERNLRQFKKDFKSKENFGFVSEDSDKSLPRKENNRPYFTRRVPSSLSDSNSSISDNLQLSVNNLKEQNNKKPRHSCTKVNHYNKTHKQSHPAHSLVDPASWFLARKDPRPLRTDLDFKNYQYNYGLFKAEEMLRVNIDQNKKAYQLKTVSPYIIDGWHQGFHKRRKRRRKSLIFFLKSLCFLLLLSSFVLVIVAVSVFLNTGGSRT